MVSCGQEAGLAYCHTVDPTFTVQVSCGPGQQFPCGFACFKQDGQWGGTVLDDAASCPFQTFPEFRVVDGEGNIVCRIPDLVIPKNAGCPDCEVQPYLPPRWKHGYGRSIVAHRRTPGLAKMVRPDGRQAFFHRVGGAFASDADGIDKLERLIDGIASIDSSKDGQGTSVVSDVTHSPFGGVAGYTLGNGQRYTRGYDTDGRIASYTLGEQTFAIG